MPTATSAYIEEVPEDEELIKDETSEIEQEVGQSSSQANSSTKKRKKKSRAKKLLSSLRDQNAIPQVLVDEVVGRVRAEHGADAPGTDEESVRVILEQLKVMDVVKGKAGLGGINRKDMGEHKFWATQPVPQMGEGPPEEDGYIEPSVPAHEVRQNIYPLPKEFEWSSMDLSDSIQLREVYELLSSNYVEDDHASFRFQYTAEFLTWALMPPGYHKEWHIGVRVASNKKLVAFISGVPVTLRVRQCVFSATEINYLCVHKKLRSKRLAPVLIKEVTRQCHLKGIFQAIYTAGVLIPTPVSTCRYQHRPLNIPKLLDIKFTFVPRNSTAARMIRQNKLPSNPHLASQGLREMEEEDVRAVTELLTRYMIRFGMSPVYTQEEIKHNLWSGRGQGDKSSGWKGRREGQVIWCYVVENPESGSITDFFSFYSLPSTVMQHPKHNLLEAAYLFYYATDVAFSPGSLDDGTLKKRLTELVGDALIIADQANFDVFNALTLMDNVEFLQNLKFGAGDGLLNFYLYNWRTAPLAGVNAEGNVPAGRGVGVVML